MSEPLEYPKPKIALIDCHNLGYMAAHTTGDMRYGKIPTGVTYGFLNQLFRFVKENGPHEFVFCWDSRHSLRREFYPDYKRRERKDDDGIDYDVVFWQFDELRTNVLPAMGWMGRGYLREGYEADDLIAWIANSNGRQKVIVSSDNDLYQLLSPVTHIYQPRKNRFYMESDFKNEYSIRPGQWPEVKAIAGCTSDNVKGIKGVGEKNAIKWIQGGLKQDSKAAQSIRDGQAVIERNRGLVTLPYGEGWGDFELSDHKLDRGRFYEVFRRYGFDQFIRRLGELMAAFGLR
uniref:Putative exonuclease n=1 Tax=viral metagenome TaxID=1070528 RepID=A0A6M3IKG9_9ZZZZ